jgi:hypothetical protein
VWRDNREEKDPPNMSESLEGQARADPDGADERARELDFLVIKIVIRRSRRMMMMEVLVDESSPQGLDGFPEAAEIDRPSFSFFVLF